jgi:hypothetical protein
MQHNFSKIRAALNFCFFWFKPKEKKNVKKGRLSERSEFEHLQRNAA